MENILLDTDVLLDFFFDRKPYSNQTAQILNLCVSKEINGFVTPVIVSNMYYLLRKTASHAYVIDKLKQLLHIVDVLKMDKQVVISSLNSDFKDFEDSLQHYSAVHSEMIAAIITRNVKDFKKSEIAVHTPETYLDIRNSVV